MLVCLALMLQIVWLAIHQHIACNVYKDIMKMVLVGVHNVRKIVHIVLMAHIVHNVITLFIYQQQELVPYVQYQGVCHATLQTSVLTVYKQCGRLLQEVVHFALPLVWNVQELPLLVNHVLLGISYRVRVVHLVRQ